MNNRAKGKVLNIGNYREISILELAELIINKTSSRSKIVHLQSREEDPKRRAADITQVRKILKWEPKISLDRGLEYTINWLKEKKNL